MTTDPPRLSPEELQRIYQELIRPLLFGEVAEGATDTPPTLVLLGGQPGAGKSRTAARLIATHPGALTPLTGDDLRIFHPDYRRLITADTEIAGPILADATRVWVRTAVQEALETRRSLLLEGTFGDPDTTLATADRFRHSGYQVRIVAVASPRVLSVVTATSRYLRDLKAGAPARFIRLSAHDRGYDGTTRLIEALDAGSSDGDRITVLSRAGRVLLDRTVPARGTGTTTAARDALYAGRHPDAWGARSTMELLGELKQITTYAIATGRLTPDVAELLLEAHALTRRTVLPRLSIAPDSPQATAIQMAVEQQEAALRRASTTRPPAAEVHEPGPITELNGLTL